jgi:hypothetical protein
VKWLHLWARDGVCSQYVIEHRLNAYLALPGLMKNHEFFRSKPWMGIMFSDESPCMENVPDLWVIMRDTLKNIVNPRKKTMDKNMLHMIFMQAIPCFHQNNKQPVVDMYISIVWNVLLALLLGLYKNANKKPHFVLRVRFFQKIHQLLTSSMEIQEQFFLKHTSLIVLAFMEYIAQIAPQFWPVEHEFLVSNNNLDIFFAKIPLICDEFRVMDVHVTWDDLEKEAASKIHKCSRTRRLNKSDFLVTETKRAACNVRDFLECPVLMHSLNMNEYKLLSHGFRIPVDVLKNGHSLIQVHVLPKNIKEIQISKLQDKYKCVKLQYMNSRLHLCVHCTYHKNNLHHKFRLNIHKEKLICSECMRDDVISVDVLGRSMVVHGNTYILCPICCTVHVYQGDGNSWISSCKSYIKQEKQEKIKCDVCGDCSVNANGGFQGNTYERINQLTGAMETIGFCFKHQPNDYAVNNCVNIHQMKNLIIRQSSWMPKNKGRVLYDY